MVTRWEILGRADLLVIIGRIYRLLRFAEAGTKNAELVNVVQESLKGLPTRPGLPTSSALSFCVGLRLQTPRRDSKSRANGTGKKNPVKFVDLSGPD